MTRTWTEKDLRELVSAIKQTVDLGLSHLPIIGFAPATEEERAALQAAMAPYACFEGIKAQIRASDRPDAQPGELDLVLSWDDV